MSTPPQKDLLTRLADAGEDAINRLSDLPGGSRFVDAANTMRARMDELQRKVRGIEELERRVAELEAQVEALQGSAAKPRVAARPKTSAPKPATPEA